MGRVLFTSTKINLSASLGKRKIDKVFWRDEFRHPTAQK